GREGGDARVGLVAGDAERCRTGLQIDEAVVARQGLQLPGEQPALPGEAPPAGGSGPRAPPVVPLPSRPPLPEAEEGRDLRDVDVAGRGAAHVLVDGGQGLAVGGEGERGDVEEEDPWLADGQRVLLLAGGGVPEADSLVRARGEGLAVGGNGEGE